LGLAVLAVWTLAIGAQTTGAAGGGYVPVHAYDAARDAGQDIRAAEAEARRTGRNVLVEVGGNWCIWCRIMDNFFQQHGDLAELRAQNYVVVFVNFSPENKNEAALGRYPKIPGYPHLFVLDGEGRLLHSQDTSALEEGRGYNAERMREFLAKWGPAKTAADRPGSQKRAGDR
jgi:thiol:disulfide interchange protein